MQNKLRRKACYVSLLAGLANPSPSYANCEQADMVGVWQFFFGNFWTTSVTLNISKTGTVTQGSYKFSGLSGELSTGSIELRNNCRLVGEFYADENPETIGPIEFKILDSRTRPDSEYWVGTFKYSFQPLDIEQYPERRVYRGTFDAVRILPQ